MITVYCSRCGQQKEVRCSPAELKRWQDGDYIQCAMPNTPAEERELLLSGICGECWKIMFRGEEDE